MGRRTSCHSVPPTGNVVIQRLGKAFTKATMLSPAAEASSAFTQKRNARQLRPAIHSPGRKRSNAAQLSVFGQVTLPARLPVCASPATGLHVAPLLAVHPRLPMDAMLVPSRGSRSATAAMHWSVAE